MIYKFIRPIVRFATKLYFRKIYISGLENIPKDKPVILACNHPSAFIEPCLLACFLPLNLHFLVRGDLFSKAWLSWLLRGTNQIPIFRQKDGLGNVRKNLITQEAVTNLFQANKCLLMFPEAHTHENIFLRPLKKGLSRFSLMDHGADLYILPVGVNFDRNIGFSSKVSIIVGEAISITEFKKKDFETESKMHVALLRNVSDSMKLCLRHIENEEREDVIHANYRLLDMQRAEPVLPVVSNMDRPFVQEKDIAERIDSDTALFEKASRHIDYLESELIKKPSVIELLFMILMLPFFVAATLIHGIPVLLVRTFVKRKITMHEFKAPVFLGILIFLYMFIMILGLILSFLFGLKFFIVFGACLLIGIVGVFYYKAYHARWGYLFSSKDIRQRTSNILEEVQFTN